MRILAEFNLILILIFAAAVAITGCIAHGFLDRDARQQVIQQAELVAGAAGGMRIYTLTQSR
jgi:MFS-type transporter involved in bile tolerance (Atg22 family)